MWFKKCCDRCNNQTNKNNEFEANSKHFKKTTEEFGYMLPYFKE